MDIDDTAFPAPVLTPWASVGPGTVGRDGSSYIFKDSTGNAFDLSAKAMRSTPPAEIQVVSAKLIITAPA